MKLSATLRRSGPAVDCQVLHWMRVFGRDNVLIVDSADMKSRQKETIEVRRPFRFLAILAFFLPQ